MNTQQLLDAAKAAQALPSDYALAARMGISRSAVSGYRHGRTRPDDTMAARLAELAGLDPDATVAAMHAQRAASEPERQRWERIAERLQRAGAAACVILSLGFWSGGPDGGALASTGAPASSAQTVSSLYIM